MNFKHFLITSSLATTLVLSACNSDDTDQAEEKEAEETEEEANTQEATVSAEDLSESLSFEGEYGTYEFTRFDTIDIPTSDEEKSAAEEEGEDVPDETEVIVAVYEFTNESDVPTSPSEAFALDLAIRQIDEDGTVPTDNYTLNIPEDSEYGDMVSESSESMIENGETATAVVAYGPIDESVETHLQSRDDNEDAEAFDVILKFED